MPQDQFKLSKPWDESKFEGILVRISEHTDSEHYGWLADLINSKFPDAKISVKEMSRLNFFVDSSYACGCFHIVIANGDLTEQFSCGSMLVRVKQSLSIVLDFAATGFSVT